MHGTCGGLKNRMPFPEGMQDPIGGSWVVIGGAICSVTIFIAMAGVLLALPHAPAN